MKIWAHRGCSQMYPENTLLSFEKAMNIEGLMGIELDVQLTKDGELVVIHDERVDRTTEGMGYVRDYILKDLSKLHIYAGENTAQRIPLLGEVLDLIESKLNLGLKLNIELKNSVYPYPFMEEKLVELIHKRGFEKSVIYSTFCAKSLEKIKEIDPKAELGILDTKASDCIYKLKGGCGATAIHPFWKGIDISPVKLKGYTVRAWMGGHLYPEKPTGTRLNLAQLEKQGITEIILNEPEKYL